MFLRTKTRKKNGKIHRYFSVVENQRVGGPGRGGRRVVQRELLHLGELNDAQHAGWLRAIEAICEDGPRVGSDGSQGTVAVGGKRGRRGVSQQMVLFPDDRQVPEVALSDSGCEAVSIRIAGIALRNPRVWGGCFLALWLWDLLGLDGFWAPRLGESRKGTRWLSVLKLLVTYRLLSPGSELRLHREWAANSAMGDLLGEDASLWAKNTLYRALDTLVSHRDDLFAFLRTRWQDLFNVGFDVLLYDLTSTYFEVDAHATAPDSKKRHGYSRDRRPDCQQVVIALVLTPEGFPLAYEIYPGNTADSATLREFLAKIERIHGGKVRRTWLMDRGIPTEDTLEHMRDAGTSYLVGTPKGRLNRLEASLADLPWEAARERVRTKLLEHDGEVYVYVESDDRVEKERAMRRRRLKRLWQRLGQLATMRLTRDQLLMHLGAARKDAGRDWALVNITVTAPPTSDALGPSHPKRKAATKSVPVATGTEHGLQFSLNKPRLAQARRREGRYLLRSNLTGEAPAQLWEKYILLTQIEQAFKDLKGDLSLRPVYHSSDPRIEAHIFTCFLAYCLFATLKHRARDIAPGLTPRAILEKLSRIQMIDVHLPTTDGRTIILPRHTEPDPETALLLRQLRITLPPQPPPKIHHDTPIPITPL